MILGAIALAAYSLGMRMIVRAKFSALREGNWHEYAGRFALGGLATVLAGGVAQFFGPQVGGLFLAFPAIFCASATLIEKHERRRKAQIWSARPREPEVTRIRSGRCG